MQNETRQCQNCKNDFIIESEDFSFYEKIKVPPPTFCPTCRLQRRFSFFVMSNFYKRTCSKCGDKIVSIHAQEKDYKVYCHKCWWADDWDGTEYAMDYDDSRHFFDQFWELQKKSYFMNLGNLEPSNVRSEYVHGTAYQKDCYMNVFADYNENCAFLAITAHTKNSMDSYRTKECENLYECTGAYKSYGSSWCEEIDNCMDCMFCRSCFNCTNCLGCINLYGKKYCIFNEQYSKEEYFEKLESFKLDTYSGQQEFFKKAKEFWQKFPRRAYLGNSLNKDVTGDIIYESKNVKDAFMVSGAENSRFVSYLSLPSTKDSYDYTSWGLGAELNYECFAVGAGAYNNKFSVECWPNALNIDYSMFTIQSKDCFGCVNLKRKQYCILNKQYTKEEYTVLKDKIVQSLKNDSWTSRNGMSYKYGEFIPPELSPFGYNETVAKDYFPLEKEEALNAGFNWFDIPEKKHDGLISPENLPESILDFTEEYLNKGIECISCKNGFNITKTEYDLLSTLKQPIPHACYKCRYKRRFEIVNKPFLFLRNCAKCNKSIQTSYAPDRPEIVYCEKCYQQEVY